jgi:dTDP-4-dehydrorhamnose reductase
VEHEHADPVAARRRRRVLITGAGGQLGRALVETFAGEDVLALTREQWDVSEPYRGGAVDLVLHAAAWTDVDGAESDPQSAAAINVGGTANAAAVGAPLVTFSTDYVFDGRKGAPYVESDGPSPLSAYGRTKLHAEAAAGPDAWVVRSSWLFGRTGHNFLRTMLRLGEQRDEVAVVDDQRGSPTYVGHLAAATRDVVDRDLPRGVWHLSADGDCTWADFAEAIFAEAGLDCGVRRISTEELGRLAPRPPEAILRSERRSAPRLPHWRDGLRECLAALRR